jgi:hypothetical protein
VKWKMALKTVNQAIGVGSEQGLTNGGKEAIETSIPYVVRGLVEKKKNGTWSPDDVLLPHEEVHAILERQERREKAKLVAAKERGGQLAERVVAEVLTREQMAKEALVKITSQADSLAERLRTAIEHMEEGQGAGPTNMRDLKDLTAAF